MRARLFSNLSHAMVAAIAVVALVLSVAAVLALREARSVAVENASCTQDVRQSQRSGNQSAIQSCNSGGGGSIVVARARGNKPVAARPNPCFSGASKRASKKKRVGAKVAPPDDIYGPGPGPDPYEPGPGGGCGSPGPGTPYPLTGNTWTQGARETDQFVGEAVYRGRCGPDGSFDAAYVRFYVDGRELGEVTLPDQASRGPHRETFQIANRYYPGGAAVLFERGKNDRRKLTATVAEGCGNGRPVVIQSLKVNVLGFR
jgi:hypothetical protein